MTLTNILSSDFMKMVSLPDTKKTELIDFAATDFLQLRDKLVDYIKAVYPTDYNNFIESDLGMMLVELVAYMGAVMSMKADMLAHENFLVTAKNRNNVKKLLELIGVTLRGPLSAAANARLTFNTSAAPITVNQENRTISITSPEDGAPLNFTLYKVVNGVVDTLNSNASIELTSSESNSDLNLVWENLALLEGSLVVQTGQFNSTESVKKIDLSESPVVEGSVQVFLDGIADSSGAWTEVDNLFYASGTDHKIFQVVNDDDFRASVIFGDGIFGKAPATNSTYTVAYRIGGGTRGNIINSFINVLLPTTNGAGTLENVSQATGGADAETVEHAKKWAPLTFRRQDRLVNLEDYTTFANNYVSPVGTAGKAKAATRKAFSSANIIDIYVLERASDLQLQQATVSFKKALLDSMNDKKMLTDEVVVVDGLIRTLDLVLSVRVRSSMLAKEEQIKADVRNVVLNYFNADNIDFGQTLVLGDLARAVFNLNDVVFATVDNLDNDVQVDVNEVIQLNNLVINVVAV